jgi:hypothetical protein
MGDPGLPPWNDCFKLKPDILDKDLKTFYEIKSSNIFSVWRGLKQLQKYDNCLPIRFPADVYTRGMWNPHQGVYAIQLPDWFGGFPLPLYFRASRRAPGLIVYSEWDVTRYALIAGLAGALLPDIWRMWRWMRPGQPLPNLDIPNIPERIAAGVLGGLGLGGGFAGLGGFGGF